MTKALALDDLRRRLAVKPGSSVTLSDDDADRRFGWDEEAAGRVLDRNLQRLEQLQYKMYADGRFGVLVVLQAIDGGGKDGTIRRVFSAFNPQGCSVASFKAPTSEELKHDYLWRIHSHTPRRGEIGVFNRSHYEDVIAARVQKLVPKSVWSKRYGHINEFERMLHDSDIKVVKIFLQISKDEQKRRFQARLSEPHKQWKFAPEDIEKSKRWNDYRKAFEAMLERCSTGVAPWYVIPADRKWFRNLAVSQILLETLEQLPLRFPPLTYDPRKIKIRL